MVVLGISLGTRTTGIAIVSGKELLDCRTLIVRTPATTTHTSTLAHYIKQYKILVIVIKLPPVSHITERLTVLLKSILKLFEYHGCMVQYKDMKAIKRTTSSITNQHSLIKFATQTFPVLTSLQDKEASNRNKYHHKLFEAVVIAHLQSHSTDNKNSP